MIWGWKFALGLIVLIFIHEMGHFLEASRERLHPSWPVFVPFLGAYVKYTRGNPWQTTRVAIAGPMLGGLGALACLPRREGGRLDTCSSRSAYFGFVLNLINLLPFGILDGGSVWRSTRWLWLGGGREKAVVSGVLFARRRSSCSRSGRSPRTSLSTGCDGRPPAPRPSGDSTPSARSRRSPPEFQAGFAQIARIDRPAVTIFGSARVPAGPPSTNRRAPSAAASPSAAGP